MMTRRDFNSTLGLLLSAAWLSSCSDENIPSFLTDYARAYRDDPFAATLKWFLEAKFGLFMHYGLYSLLGRGEWVQFHEKIPVLEYQKLRDRFTA